MYAPFTTDTVRAVAARDTYFSGTREKFTNFERNLCFCLFRIFRKHFVVYFNSFFFFVYKNVCIKCLIPFQVLFFFLK